MAMSGAALGAAIASRLTRDSGASEEMKLQITELWQDLATEIVSHIQANAQVTVTVSTTGTAAAQSGTGTGSIA